MLKLTRERETRERKGGFERARRVANRNEEDSSVVEEQSRTGAIDERSQCKKERGRTNDQYAISNRPAMCNSVSFSRSFEKKKDIKM